MSLGFSDRILERERLEENPHFSKNFINKFFGDFLVSFFKIYILKKGPLSRILKILEREVNS